MNAKDAYTLLETLLDGIDPITGEMLPAEHVCQEPDVLRALHRALTALKNDMEPAEEDNTDVDPTLVNKNGRLNAGRPWTQKDLDWLKQLHEAGANMDEMCYLLQRRKRGIEKQLAYLGLVDAKAKKLPAEEKNTRSGMPWTAEDDKTMWDLWKNGAPEENIARLLHRTPYAVHCRMERLGMLEPEDADAPPLLPPWSLADVQKLQRMHASGCTAEEIAKEMHRSVESISARLFYMGLSKKTPITLHPQEPT